MKELASYNDFINGMGEAVFIQHLDTGVIYDVNESMLKMFGYSKNEIIGGTVEKLSDLTEGYSLDRALNKIQSAKKGNTEVFDWKSIKKDGTSFWVEVSLKLVLLNETKWIIALVRDITEKKRTELLFHQFTDFQLLLSELSTKFISLPNDKLDYEIDFTLRLIAKRLKADRSYIFTYSHDLKNMSNVNEWCNAGIKSFIEKLQNLNVDDFKWHHNTLANSGAINIHDIRKMDESAAKEKKEFLLEKIKSILIVPFYNNGKIIGFIGLDAVKEYRKWKKSDVEELKAIGNLIGQSIIRRNYENDLQKAKEKAEESDRLKSAFLSNMSHEIRTPMNGILGFAEILESDELKHEERLHYIKIIQDSGKQLLSIINDIIDISKIEAGQINIALEKVNLNDLMLEIINFFEPIGKSKGIEVKFKNNIHAKESLIDTDEVKVKQILTNLINNAIKFTPSGYVSLTSFLSDSNYIFSIEDSGVGMDEETLRVIFNRFTRANDKFSTNISGTGLGLSISKAYAEKLGGSIKVKSKKGKGSIFTFYLPTNCSNIE